MEMAFLIAAVLMMLLVWGAAPLPKPFVSDVSYGSLSHSNQCHAIYFAGKRRRTYVTYMNHDFDACLTYYDHDTKRWAKRVAVDDCLGPNKYKDGHNNPISRVTSDGYVHLFYGCHGSPAKYARSAAPESIAKWQTGARVGRNVTYMFTAELAGGELLLFYRSSGGKRFHAPFVVRRSADGGKSWIDRQVVLDFGKGVARPSYIFYDKARNRIHLSVANLLYHGGGVGNAYYVQYDVKTGHVYALNGKDLGRTATKEELIANHSRIAGRNTPKSKGYGNARPCVHEGTPYFILTDRHGREPLYFARWDGRKLARTLIPPEKIGGKLIGSRALHTTDGKTFRMYGFCVTTPSKKDKGGDLKVWTSRDGGRTWDSGKTLADRRMLGHGLQQLELVRNYPGDGPFLIVSEAYKATPKGFKLTPAEKRRARSSGHYDNPMRANTRFYALDVDGKFIASAD